MHEVEVTSTPLSCIENSRCFPVGSAIFLSKVISTLSISFEACMKLGIPGGETLTVYVTSADVNVASENSKSKFPTPLPVAPLAL